MEWVAVAVVMSAAYVYAPILRVHAARRLRFSVPAVEQQLRELAAAQPAVELPEAIAAICEAESEDWAREQQRDRARALYAEHGDWGMVAQHLAV